MLNKPLASRPFVLPARRRSALALPPCCYRGQLAQRQGVPVGLHRGDELSASARSCVRCSLAFPAARLPPKAPTLLVMDAWRVSSPGPNSLNRPH